MKERGISAIQHQRFSLSHSLFSIPGSVYLNDLLSFDPVEMTWNVLNPTGSLPTGRALLGMCAIRENVFVFGGTNSQGEFFLRQNLL